MNTTSKILMAGALSALMCSTMPAQAQTTAPVPMRPQPLTVSTVAGSVRIQQNVPCGNMLDLATPIAEGRVDMTWQPTTRTDMLFDLVKMTMFLTPFHVDASCNDIRGSVDFREVGIQLASALKFTGEPIGDPGARQFAFRIPKEQFLIFESVLDSVDPKKPEISYQKPSEDVTGVIDLRRQTVQMRVVLTTQLHFRVGCDRERCVIDETHNGTITSDIRGSATARTGVIRK
jgi:hypothetical protein